MKALGAMIHTATRILTDNLSNQRVAANAQAASASRFFLVRSTCLHQRITDGDITVLHVPDPQNPSDFLTKFIDTKKTEASIRYASGKVHTDKLTLNAADAEMWATFEPDVCAAHFISTVPVSLSVTLNSVPHPARQAIFPHECELEYCTVCNLPTASHCYFPYCTTSFAVHPPFCACLADDYDSE